MINHNGNFPNLDGIENGGLSAQCLMVDKDPLRATRGFNLPGVMLYQLMYKTTH